ncbi:MAG: hypothetical protein ACOX3O_08530 [bacterium]
MTYKKLFEPGKIGNVTIKNRVVMPPMGTGLAFFSGEASPDIIRYYEERARGGCGLIITEITRIDDEHGMGPCQAAGCIKAWIYTGPAEACRYSPQIRHEDLYPAAPPRPGRTRQN